MNLSQDDQIRLFTMKAAALKIANGQEVVLDGQVLKRADLPSVISEIKRLESKDISMSQWSGRRWVAYS